MLAFQFSVFICFSWLLGDLYFLTFVIGIFWFMFLLYHDSPAPAACAMFFSCYLEISTITKFCRLDTVMRCRHMYHGKNGITILFCGHIIFHLSYQRISFGFF